MRLCRMSLRVVSGLLLSTISGARLLCRAAWGRRRRCCRVRAAPLLRPRGRRRFCGGFAATGTTSCGHRLPTTITRRLGALAALAGDRALEIRRRVSASRRCPPAALRSLARDAAVAVRSRVAENPECPPEAFAVLASDGTEPVRVSAAGNMSCPSGVLDELAADPSDAVRSAVAANPACPSGALAVLSSDRHLAVRSAVASNQACPPGLFVMICMSLSRLDRCNVAANPACPELLLRRLGTDPDEKVREAARRALLGRGRLSVP